MKQNSKKIFPRLSHSSHGRKKLLKTTGVFEFFFFLHTERVGKGLSISVDTYVDTVETTSVFLK